MRKTLITSLLMTFFVAPIARAQSNAIEANHVVSEQAHQIEGSAPILHLRLDYDVLETTDAGLHWIPIALPDELTGRLHHIESNGDTLWVASESGLFQYVREDQSWEKLFSEEFSLIKKTTRSVYLAISADSSYGARSDDGKNWSQLTGPEDLLGVAEGSDGLLWINTRKSVYTSADNGLTWKRFAETQPTETIEYLYPFDNGEMLALSRNKVWQSDHAQDLWRETGTMPAHGSVVKLFQFTEPRIFGLVVTDTGNQHRTNSYLSGDSGRAWATTTLPASGRIFDTYFPSDTTMILAVGYKHHKRGTADFFEWFAQAVLARLGVTGFPEFGEATYSNSLSHSQITDILPYPNGKVIATRFIHFAFFNEVSDWLYTSNNYGATWDLLPHNEINRKISRSVNGTLFLTGDQNLIRSKDEGETWDTVKTNIDRWFPIGPVTDNGDGLLFMVSVGPEFTRRFHLSYDDGDTWELRSTGPITGNITKALFDGSETIYGLEAQKLLISEDSGTTWIPRAYDDIADIALGLDGYPLVMTTTGVLVSLRSLGTLRVELGTIVDGFNDPGIRSLAVDEEGIFYAGNHDGRVWSSRDNGVTWRVLAKIPGDPTEIPTMAMSPDKMLYLGTNDRGIWRLDIDQIGSIEGEVATPEQLDLR